jgi:hypothetical protein
VKEINVQRNKTEKQFSQFKNGSINLKDEER